MAHLTSFRLEFQKEEAKENERSLSGALLCSGLFRRGMVYEQERVMAFSAPYLSHMIVQYCRDSV